MAAGNDDAPDAANVEGTRKNTDAANSIAHRKRLDGARARAAIAGVALQVCHQDHGVVYLACRWNMTREFQDLDQVDAFLEQIGAKGS